MKLHTSIISILSRKINSSGKIALVATLSILVALIVFVILVGKRNKKRIAADQNSLLNLKDQDKIISGKFEQISRAPGVILILLAVYVLISSSLNSTIYCGGEFWVITFFWWGIDFFKNAKMWETAIFYVTRSECVLKTTNKNVGYAIPINNIVMIRFKNQKLIITVSGRKRIIKHITNAVEVSNVIYKLKKARHLIL